MGFPTKPRLKMPPVRPGSQTPRTPAAGPRVSLPAGTPKAPAIRKPGRAVGY